MKNNYFRYLIIIRPLNVFIAFLSIFIGGFVTGTIHPLSNLLLAALSGALIASGANVINDFFDLDIDRINKPYRPLPSGAVKPAEAFLFSLVLFVLGIVCSIWINIPAFCIAVVTAFVLFAYSWKLKRTVLWGNMTVAFVTGLAFVYGGVSVSRIREALIVGIFSFFYHLGREIIKDAEDVEGDKKDGVITLPIRYGVRRALLISTTVLSVLILLTLIPYWLKIFSFTYLLIVVLGVDCFLIYVIISMWNDKSPAHLGKLAFMMKLNMLIGLISVYFGR